MLETTMYVRCTHCGYDNSPEYRFCGMCGATLAHQAIPTKPPLRDVTLVPKPTPAMPPNEKPAPAPETLAGPSFLGLGEDPKEEPKAEFHYLYEDEPVRSYAGLIMVLIVALGIGGLGYWQWRHHGFPFSQDRGATAAQPPVSPSEGVPSQPQEQHAQADQSGQADAKQPEAPILGTKASSEPPPTSTGASDQEEQTREPGSTSPPRKEVAKASPPPSVSRKAGPRPPAPKRVPQAASIVSTTKPSPDADLELAGERALYGTGVPRNCAKAQSNLSTAAAHGNSKAQTVLGTMYATGHCVGRDLPAAYRWFARALRSDPQNSRISADLQILWRQMSADERQLATAKSP